SRSATTLSTISVDMKEPLKIASLEMAQAQEEKGGREAEHGRDGAHEIRWVRVQQLELERPGQDVAEVGEVLAQVLGHEHEDDRKQRHELANHQRDER